MRGWRVGVLRPSRLLGASLLVVARWLVAHVTASAELGEVASLGTESRAAHDEEKKRR